jgi:DUF4097 and DUF4098 domain-containing protein YvlB
MRVETFQTPEPPKLRIFVPSGDVRVETADTAETTVEVVGTLEDDAKIELHRNEIVIEVGKKRIFGIGGDHMVRIRAPNGTEVDANVASADVEGRGRFGHVEVNSASGDVTFEDVEGRLSVNSASGDVEVRHVTGEARINSASGDITLGEADSDVRVRTASGDQKVRSASSGKLELQSASGDVEVGIRRGSKVWVDASSMSGDTTSELELSDEPSESEGPTVDFRARTMSGDVTVRRAP